MDLSFDGISYSLDINSFTAYDHEPCGVDEDDMAALEEKGITNSDMETYSFRLIPLAIFDISGVYGLDIYASIEMFQDSISNLSPSKRYICTESEYDLTDNDGNCYDCEQICYVPHSYTEYLSISYAKTLEVGITPKHTSTYPNTYSVSSLFLSMPFL
ncbi:hypothetical protein ADUPG1_012481 [Aduncisulcus paluster]|uniref:Uncharacterized protein n=1 Tax=Aduncisulcus paluster TaxID=2918883 RepID=A0ABQ5JZL7_9EUKA|nr:hypothetical protein ADUPG1_012481 [Aduncisulcus paluster]